MKKRTLKAGKFQRHYATNGILMYRERKKLIEVPEGTLVTILKARRQSHLCSVRCVEQQLENDKGAVLVLGTGRKAMDICIAIETEFLPKLKIEGAAPAKAKTGKAKSKGTKTAALPVVAVEANQPDVAPGIAPADIQPAAEAPAPAPQAEAPAPAAEAAPVEQAAVPAEAAV